MSAAKARERVSARARSSDAPPSPAPSPGPRRILLATPERHRSVTSLRRAIAHARRLEAEVHVVTVVPESGHVDPLFPQLHVLDAIRGVERARRAGQATRSWLDAVPDFDPAAVHVHVRTGSFVDEVAELARELDVERVIMPPLATPFGATVTALARAAGVPVLVARAPTSHETIVAATDLEDPSYPVIRAAVALAAGLETPIVALHNAVPGRVSLASAAARASDRDSVTSGGEGRRQLERAAAWPELFAEAVVANDPSPVEAILREARARDADLVVVGSRPRSWLSRVFGSSVASDVVNLARRSVLVAPLEA